MRMLGARGVFLELAGNVFDGRQRAENMNLFVRRFDVNLQFAFVRAHPNVLIMIDNFNEVGIRILFQFFEDGMKNGHRFARLFGGVTHVFARNEMHGHGDGRGRNPHMNVRTTGAVFVNVNADDAFMEGIGAREYECAAKSESCFRE